MYVLSLMTACGVQLRQKPRILQIEPPACSLKSTVDKSSDVHHLTVSITSAMPTSTNGPLVTRTLGQTIVDCDMDEDQDVKPNPPKVKMEKITGRYFERR